MLKEQLTRSTPRPPYLDESFTDLFVEREAQAFLDWQEACQYIKAQCPWYKMPKMTFIRWLEDQRGYLECSRQLRHRRLMACRKAS
jgi:hypothetical protein